MDELILVTGPASEPVTLTEAKNHLRVDVSDDDALISSLIGMAREVFEDLNGRTLFTTTWRLKMEEWPEGNEIVLPRPPLQSVSSISYVDSAGNSNTFSSGDYVVETERTPGRVVLGYGQSWPTATLRPGLAITVNFVAGWTTTEAIPKRYKQALLLLIGHGYAHREAVLATGAMPKEIPLGFKWMAEMDRVW